MQDAELKEAEWKRHCEGCNCRGKSKKNGQDYMGGNQEEKND